MRSGIITNGKHRFDKTVFTPFPPIRRKTMAKHRAGLPAYNAPVHKSTKNGFVAYRPPSSHLLAVKEDRRSYGCGGSGATLPNGKFLSSLLNSFRRKSTVRSYEILFIVIYVRHESVPKKLNTVYQIIPFSSSWKSNSKTPTPDLRATR